MRERISNVDNEDYHKIVYPTIVSGEMVMQLSTDGNHLIYPNPEKYAPIVPDSIPETKIRVVHGAQAEMRFIKPSTTRMYVKG